MSNYVNAPATKMVATHCACCGRPLVDAKSVETAVGPICREKFGFDMDVPEASRVRANELVYKIALDRTAPEVKAYCEELTALGFELLAEKCLVAVEKAEEKAAKDAKIRVEVIDGRVRLTTPYDAEFVDELKKIAGRKWHKAEKVWSFPVSARSQLWAALRLSFAGKTGVGPKGVFTIPEAA
jgi:hypothetical protein